MSLPEFLVETERNSRQNLAEGICKLLRQKEYVSAFFVHSAEEAARSVLAMIPCECSVGIPGSVTVRQLGLPQQLAERGNVVHQHWNCEYTFADKERQNYADWFITSSNAITTDGVMVNIDGAGNRIASMAWGRSEIVYIIGMNKVEFSLDSAILRARNVASPANALRTSAATPCTLTGRCHNCGSKERICRVMLISERAPFDRKCHVILVGENLGY